MRRLLSILPIFLLLSACTSTPSKISIQSPIPVVEQYPIEFGQRIALPEKPIASESAKAKRDESVLSVLLRTHSVQTKEYSFGTVVTAIDQVAGGKDGMYWIFYVNGSMSTIGAGEYLIKSGDVITWKLQKEGETL